MAFLESEKYLTLLKRLLKVTSARKVFEFLKKSSGYLDFYDFFCETHRTKVGDVIIDISV